MRNWQISIKPGGRVFEYCYDRDQGIMQCTPLPTKEELGDWYGNNFNYGWFEKRRILKRVQAWHRWQRVKKYLKVINSGAYLLDVGCGHGLFLDFARQENCATFGSEFESSASKAARRSGHAIYPGDFLDIDFGGMKFDVITLWHCLEHFVDPEAVLNKLRDMLTDDGTVIVAVPNLSCRGVALKDVEWVWIQQPFVHIWHWTPDSLSSLLQKNGFEVCSVRTWDTWDANRFYDGNWGPKFERYIYGAGRLCDRFFRKLGFTSFRIFEDKVSFIIAETMRLLSYLLCWVFNAVCSKQTDGSELFIVGRKR